MKISILTMFPEMLESFLRSPVAARAVRRELVEIEVVDIRGFAGGSYRHIDDSTFGGGAGMLMRAKPILDALSNVRADDPSGAAVRSVLLSPAGRVYDQRCAHDYAKLDHLILICGHYEGVDARVEGHVDELLSIGDYVLTGGELAAQVVADSVVRLLGAIRQESTREESHEQGLLEYPQYTQPADLDGEKVPEVLLSGNHERIRRWRLEQSLRRTLHNRPDLLEGRELSAEEREILESLQKESAAD